MSIINWNKSYYVGIEEVDRQHENLVAIINHLYEAMTEGRGKSELGSILKKLINYTQLHFKTEEKIFKMSNYPASKEHIQEHSDFTAKVVRFSEDFLQGRMGLSIEVMNFLCDWLKNHVKNSDQDFGKHVQENCTYSPERVAVNTAVPDITGKREIV